MDKFLQENHTFDDYVREVRKYQKIYDDVSYNSQKVTYALNVQNHDYSCVFIEAETYIKQTIDHVYTHAGAEAGHV